MEQNGCNIKDIKRAMLGEDLRGGLVRDVGLIKDQIHEMQTEAANQKAAKATKAERTLSWRIAAISAISILGGIALEYLLSKL